ncbi:hypothetical protein IG631_11428 [Alternaria alternata]|nr:hypothetical protein IG631_11428 [Alternaria alternata]
MLCVIRQGLRCHWRGRGGFRHTERDAQSCFGILAHARWKEMHESVKILLSPSSPSYGVGRVEVVDDRGWQ